MTEWVRVATAGDVTDGEMTAYPARDRTITVANVGGALHAFDDVCTHQGCSLAEGDVDGTVVRCPCHGSEFDITSGEVVEGPATDPIDVFDVREEDGELRVALE